MSDKVFIYWDNSNIFIEARRLAAEHNSGADARMRVRINFDAMLRLAHADRPIGRAVAAGSVPPEIRQLWNRMESKGVEVKLFDRLALHHGEQEVPDQILQLAMLKDGIANREESGCMVVLTGDGRGYSAGAGFHHTLEQLHGIGWGVEILSWRHACSLRMREWAEEIGVFVALDDFYESITFLEPSRPGHATAKPRASTPLDLSRRKVAGARAD